MLGVKVELYYTFFICKQANGAVNEVFWPQVRRINQLNLVSYDFLLFAEEPAYSSPCPTLSPPPLRVRDSNRYQPAVKGRASGLRSGRLLSLLALPL